MCVVVAGWYWPNEAEWGSRGKKCGPKFYAVGKEKCGWNDNSFNNRDRKFFRFSDSRSTNKAYVAETGTVETVVSPKNFGGIVCINQ